MNRVKAPSMSLTATPLTLTASRSASATLQLALIVSEESVTIPTPRSSALLPASSTSWTLGAVAVRFDATTPTERGHIA